MPKQNDISSTERLLNVIRNTDPVKETPVFSSPTSKRSFIPPVRKMFSKSALSVGVDISGDCIRLVKAEHHFNKKPSVLDFRSVPLDSDVTDDKNRMADLLRSQLAPFCSATPPPAIWTSLPQEETDIRCLRIPRVPAGKLENVVYWTYQKEAPFDKDKTILDFRVLGDVIDNGVVKTEVLVCATPGSSVENLKAMFNAAGHEPAGVIAPSFTIQNYFKTDWLEKKETLTCSLLIDFKWSRIDIFRPDGELIVSRGIKAGISSMIESIKSETSRAAGALSTPDGLDEEGQVLDLPAFETNEADQALEILNTDPPASLPAVSGMVKEEDVFEMVLPALERLIRQVERTLEHVSLRFSDGPIGNMLVSGPITAYPRLVKHVGTQLGLPLTTVDPFAHSADGLEVPETAGGRAEYVSSAGLALSGRDHTPNFLLTHREAGEKRRKTRFKQAVLAIFLLGIVTLWGVHLVLQGQLRDLETRISRLIAVDSSDTVVNDREALLALAARTNSDNQVRKTYAAKCFPAAMIGEVTTLAPDRIRFVSIEGSGPAGSEDAGSAASVFMDAMVFGPGRSVETILAQYLLTLKRSPLFSQVILKKKTFEQLNSQDVLRFTLELEGA